MTGESKNAHSAYEHQTKKYEDEIASYKDKVAQLEAQLKQAEAHDAKTGAENREGLEDSVATPPPVLRIVLGKLDEVMETVREHDLNNLHLTTAMRMRQFGAGERRWGMIEKTADMAESNPQYFTEPISSYAGLRKLIENVEMWRDADDTAEQIARLSRDHYLVTSNAAYAMSRIYYRNLQGAAQAGDVVAQELFNELRTYYRTPGRKRNQTEEPTVDELVRDVKALAKGRKEGEVSIRNENARETKAARTMVDDAHKPSEGHFRETVEGVICEACGTENQAHAKFCINCGAGLKS
jgi:hypothetical protein